MLSRSECIKQPKRYNFFTIVSLHPSFKSSDCAINGRNWVESELGKVQHFILLYQSNMEKYQKPTLNAYSFGFVEINRLRDCKYLLLKIQTWISVVEYDLFISVYFRSLFIF